MHGMQVPAELEKLLPLAEARPLELAMVAPGYAENVLQALVASGANISGEDGARAVMTGLAAAKRARVHTLLDCQVSSLMLQIPRTRRIGPQQASTGKSLENAQLVASALTGEVGVQASVVHRVPLWWPPLATPEGPCSHMWEIAARSEVAHCSAAWDEWQFNPVPTRPPPALLLSPLQWLLAASADALPSPLPPPQLKQMLQEALCCLGDSGSMGEMPRLPVGEFESPKPRCSASFYLLK
jgi:hypothetical protein